MNGFFLGSKAQAHALPLGSCIRTMQTFGRKWTRCNLGCSRPFCRKSSRFESDDVQILCLICIDFQKFKQIASVPEPIICTGPIGSGCLFVLMSPARKRDRLENPQPPEYHVCVIRMPAPFDWFHLHSSLTLSSLLS